MLDVGCWSFGCRHPIEQRIRLEPLAQTIGAWRVGAITGEQNAHVHFVGLGFQPAEIAFDAIPRARPFMLFIRSVVRFTFDYEGLPFLWESLERHVSWN